MTPFQPLHLSVRAVTIVTSYYSTAAQTIQCAYATMDGERGRERVIAEKGALILYSLGTGQP